jgi:hypothetical protein
VAFPTDVVEFRRRVSAAFVDLASVRADDGDRLVFCGRLVEACRNLLEGIDGVGVMLAGPGGELRLRGYSCDRIRELELFELHLGAGPCLTAYERGEIGQHPDLDPLDSPWTAYLTRVRAAGWRGIHAIPLRSFGETVGVINLFGTGSGPLCDDAQRLGRALADLAAYALVDAVPTGTGTRPETLDPTNPVHRARGHLQRAQELSLRARELRRVAQEASRRAQALRQMTNERLSRAERLKIDSVGTPEGAD